MAYIVLALGAFLSIGGALSIFHGAGIVEVERGWTGVIAGATALTGGIVTIALGLILKTLLELRPMLATRAALTAEPADLPREQDVDRRPAEGFPAAPVTQPTSLMTAELEGGMLAAMLAPADVPDEAERPFGAPAEPQKARSLPVADTFAPVHPDREHAASERAELPELDMASAAPAPEAEKPRFKINFKRQPPASLPPEPKPAEVPEEPAMDDWLDRAFSALDNESPLAPHHPPEPLPPHVTEPVSDPEPIAALAAAEPPPPIPEPELEPVRPAPAPPPTSTVIGRYEADGTAYVMYADGSIEAQSDAGVFRFNSMTELKAFIENA